MGQETVRQYKDRAVSRQMSRSFGATAFEKNNAETIARYFLSHMSQKCCIRRSFCPRQYFMCDLVFLLRSRVELRLQGSVFHSQRRLGPATGLTCIFGREALTNAGATDLKTPNFPFVCSIHKKAQKAHVAYSLGRYFSAPSRGQFFLAEAGFTGVDGDRWMLKPTISILVERAYEREIRSMAKYFSEREGANIDIVSKTPADANATINLIGKSNAKEYLPDLLIGFGSLGTENSIYSPISRQAGVGASVSFSAKSKKTALRFWKFLQNDT